MHTYMITEHGVLSDSPLLQTKEIQRVLDLCKENGGVVVFPQGRYLVSSLRMWSNTTLCFQAGAILLGSEECEDYEIFDVPEGVELRTDMELITQYFKDKPWQAYRRAMISAYGVHDIAIIGEEGCLIDGQNCYDPNGEEGFRGPHGIFITNSQNITLKGYTIANNGNFMHQLDNCQNITMENVVCLAGHDGVHLHHCRHTLLQNCRFITGDDCIAGINVKDLVVRDCVMNTSCQIFRMGGHDILVERCHMYGPGYYPHRFTIVKGKRDELPREAGRHNLIAVVCHFASTNFPSATPYGNFVFRDCQIDNADCFLHYYADFGTLESGAYLGDMTLENVTFTGLLAPSDIRPCETVPLHISLKNVQVDFREGAYGDTLFPESPFIQVTTT